MLLSGAQDMEFRQVQDLKAWLSSAADSPIRDAADPLQAGDWQKITSTDAAGAHLLDKNLSSSANTLTYLAPGYGYWIKMNRPGYLVLTGQTLPASATRHLQQGWNLMGPLSSDTCYYQTAQPPCPMKETPAVNFVPTSGPAIPAALSSISGKYQRVIGSDCEGAKLYDTLISSSACTLRYFAPGFGYWIKMTQAGDLTL